VGGGAGRVGKSFSPAPFSGNFIYSNPFRIFPGSDITAIAFSGSNASSFALPAVGACQHTFLPIIFKQVERRNLKGVGEFD
jgi:hypothetical protein